MEADVITFGLHYDAWCADRLSGLSGVKPFEFFCADQFLKDRSLSDKEIISGQVDASEDGGVDSFYCFFNRVLIDDTTQVDARAGGDVELKIIQSKQGDGFSPTAINKLGSFIDDLLTLSRPLSDYNYRYHDKLARLMDNCKVKFKELTTRSVPKLSIEFFFITRVDVEPNRNAKQAAAKMVEKASRYYSETNVEPFRFINAARLWTQFKIAHPSKKGIHLVKSFDTKEGWVGLVTLKDYYEFLKDANPTDDGRPRIDEHIFDSNVRGYQQNARVNTRITNTLTAGDTSTAVGNAKTKPKPPEFWQLNNGITILSPSAVYGDELLTITNPQIVNGLQTSRRIFDYCRSKDPFPESDTRRILIRVIKTDDESTRSEIIRATNDQNPMPPEAFLSTLRIQHQIETFFESKGLFYDRRKGHYKSLNKPAAQIVGIVDLMQALIAIMLRKPDYARGRPRDYLKDKKRQLLFGADDRDADDESPSYKLDVYLRCVQIVRKVDSFLSALDLDSNTSLNLRFYVALDMATGLAGNAHCPPDKISAIDVERDFTEARLKESYKRLRALYMRYGGDDDAAKGKDMVAALLKSLKKRHSPPKKKAKGKKKK
jgi:hypothetical protein